ncbi:hypothetical protein Ple7327_0877 [Pleurocapsa sp. PCC 7327]|uniref:hypothetical protein n=1 Tax=Pleurocapsa sp. PCC 7327 TaxID=118163 RepID=UPI00029FB61E|nr:hypothetical protein [Pleurocapsa sp. PCC 7327]AFY76304.1 hypothetical protein Ple7327_0877 [Pleurocapsa sp. PCC 7327]
MLKVGTLIRVIYPEYAVGIHGYLQAEEKSGRWIVKLLKNPLEDEDDKEPLLLSLEESDFEAIEPPYLTKKIDESV